MEINQKISEKNEVLAKKQTDLAQFINETRSAVEEDKLEGDKLTQSMDKIKKDKAEIEKLQEEIRQLEEGKELLNDKEDVKKDSKDKENEKEKALSEKRNLEEKDMKKLTDNNLENGKNKINSLESRSFVAYIRSKGEKRDGVKTEGNEVVIPHQILTVQKQPNDPNQLYQYIHRQQVTAPNGSLPILQKTSAGLVTKEELAENPEIAAFVLKGVDYSVRTYAGVLPVSNEILEDAQADISGIVSEYIENVRALTEQRKIGAVLQQAAVETATTLDDFKDIFNKKISAGYNKAIVLTQSAYAELDKVKDKNGRYMMQDSITSPTGKVLLGANVYVVNDAILGVASGVDDGTEYRKAFIGDLYAFCLEAVKSQMTVKWQDNDIFAQKCVVNIRMDFQEADEMAGKFVDIQFTADNAVPDQPTTDGKSKKSA